MKDYKRTEIPLFTNKSDLFDFIVKNKALLIEERKMFPKYGDAVSHFQIVHDKESNATKANTGIDRKLIPQLSEILIKVVINTTNLMDSHKDVHIPGLWKKSVKENKAIMLLKEHVMSFENIIADGSDLKAYTQEMTWKELGAPYKGVTEALRFDAVVKRDRNPYMFEQYAKGYVRMHSVGMKYIAMIPCVNDEKYAAEFEAWEKYFPMVVNSDEAEDVGYFWAIKEGRAAEGSAVPRGSNTITPTLSVEESKEEPGDHSDKEETEPPVGTQLIDYKFLTNQFKNFCI